jgi:hypothetical protein
MSEYRVSETTLSAFAMVRQYSRTVRHIIAEADHDEAAVGKHIMDLADRINRMRDEGRL